MHLPPQKCYLLWFTCLQRFSKLFRLCLPIWVLTQKIITFLFLFSISFFRCWSESKHVFLCTVGFLTGSLRLPSFCCVAVCCHVLSWLPFLYWACQCNSEDTTLSLCHIPLPTPFRGLKLLCPVVLELPAVPTYMKVTTNPKGKPIISLVMYDIQYGSPKLSGNSNFQTRCPISQYLQWKRMAFRMFLGSWDASCMKFWHPGCWDRGWRVEGQCEWHSLTSLQISKTNQTLSPSLTPSFSFQDCTSPNFP